MGITPEVILLSETPCKGATHLPLLETLWHTPSVTLKGIEALVFTSKNGVQALERIAPWWKQIASYVIGEATAQRVRDLGGRVAYVSAHQTGDAFAHALLPLLHGKKALYVRAKKVASKLEEILRVNGISLVSVVGYETVCATEERLPPPLGAVILFTSPSTVRCFLERFGWNPLWHACAIGPTTASALPPTIHAQIAPQSTLKEAVAYAKSSYNPSILTQAGA